MGSDLPGAGVGGSSVLSSACATPCPGSSGGRDPTVRCVPSSRQEGHGAGRRRGPVRAEGDRAEESCVFKTVRWLYVLFSPVNGFCCKLQLCPWSLGSEELVSKQKPLRLVPCASLPAPS